MNKPLEIPKTIKHITRFGKFMKVETSHGVGIIYDVKVTENIVERKYDVDYLVAFDDGLIGWFADDEVWEYKNQKEQPTTKKIDHESDNFQFEDDDGVRLLGTSDLIFWLKHRIKHKYYFSKKNKKRDKKLLKWLQSLKSSYGWTADPFKNAILKQFNLAQGREKEY